MQIKLIREALLGSTRADVVFPSKGTRFEDRPFVFGYQGLPLIQIHPLNAQVPEQLTLEIRTAQGKITLAGVPRRLGAESKASLTRFKTFFPATTKREPITELAPDQCALTNSKGHVRAFEMSDLQIHSGFPCGAESRIVGHMNEDHVPALRDKQKHNNADASQQRPP
ncbi:MAG: hypothetical protein AAF384_08905 [Pseudomonadota bacterium]